MSAHAAVTEFVRSTFPGLPMQLLGTVLALLALSLVAETVRRVGPWLKGRLDGALVESVQAGVMTVTTAGVGVFLVVVWRAGGMVTEALVTAQVEQDQVIAGVLTLAVLAAAYSLTRVSKRFIARVTRERNAISTHHQEVAHHVTQIAIYVLAGLVVLGLFGVQPESLVVGAGVATVFLGLAARQTLGAVLAGFVVLFSRPFELGDWVRIDDKEGVVTDITVVNTQLRTFDEEYVMIPNDIVTSQEVVNRSRKGRLRLETEVGVDYDTDLEEAMAVAREALLDIDVVMRRPEPSVVLSEFGSSAVVVRLRYYIERPSARKMWKARTDVITAIKTAFEAEDIKIPYPQYELSGRPERGGFEVVDGVGGVDGSAGSEKGVGSDEAASEAEGTAGHNGEGGK